MLYKIILQPRAIRELLDAWIWYEERQAGLGDRFENEIYKRINQIEKHPEDTRSENNFFVRQKLKLFHS